MATLVVVRPEAAPASAFARLSATALDRALEADGELAVGAVADEAVVLGAFQRPSEVASDLASSVHLRVSGGGAVRVGPGGVWVNLALRRADAFVACDASTLVNRYVRPLLRALGKSSGKSASYFGRDWISVAHHPVAACGFAHDAKTGRAVFEAFVAVEAPFAAAARASFRDKSPSTLVALAGRPIAVSAVIHAIVEAYATMAIDASATTEDPTPSRERVVFERGWPTVGEGDPVAPIEPAWSARIDEAIGPIYAGRDASGRVRLGGELMASRDAVAALEEAVAEGESLDVAVARLATGEAATFGVRDFASVRDVLAAALRTSPGAPSSS